MISRTSVALSESVTTASLLIHVPTVVTLFASSVKFRKGYKPCTERDSPIKAESESEGSVGYVLEVSSGVASYPLEYFTLSPSRPWNCKTEQELGGMPTDSSPGKTSGCGSWMTLSLATLSTIPMGKLAKAS